MPAVLAALPAAFSTIGATTAAASTAAAVATTTAGLSAAAIGAAALGTTTLVVGTITSAAINSAIGIGLNLVGSALMGTPKTGSLGGIRDELRLDPTYPRQIAFGRAVNGGSLVYVEAHNTMPDGTLSGQNRNKNLEVVIALADHRCGALHKVYLDGTECTFGTDYLELGKPVTNFQGESSFNTAYLRLYDGSQTAADQRLEDVLPSVWDANRIGTGVTYVRATTVYRDKDKIYTGIPEWRIVHEGGLFYDPRKDTTVGGSGSHRWLDLTTYEYTRNPVIIAYNILRGVYARVHNGTDWVNVKIYGADVEADRIPLAEVFAAANACDESVLKKSGASEPRYQADGTISVDSEPLGALQALMASCAGDIAEIAGYYRFYAGVSRSSLRTITIKDVRADKAARYKPKKPLEQLVNGVGGTYVEPADAFSSKAFPTRKSATDIAKDRREKIASLDLEFVQSGTQAQRIAEIVRRKMRMQRQWWIPLVPEHLDIEPGDVLTINLPQTLNTNVTVIVTKVDAAPNCDVDIEVIEYGSSIYSWTAATDEIDADASEGVPDDPGTIGDGGTDGDATVTNGSAGSSWALAGTLTLTETLAGILDVSATTFDLSAAVTNPANSTTKGGAEWKIVVSTNGGSERTVIASGQNGGSETYPLNCIWNGSAYDRAVSPDVSVDGNLLVGDGTQAVKMYLRRVGTVGINSIGFTLRASVTPLE